MVGSINGEGGYSLSRTTHDRKTNIAKQLLEGLSGSDAKMIEVVDGQLRQVSEQGDETHVSLLKNVWCLLALQRMHLGR